MGKIRRAGLIEKAAEVRPLSALRWLDSVRRDFFLDRPTTILAEPPSCGLGIGGSTKNKSVAQQADSRLISTAAKGSKGSILFSRHLLVRRCQSDGGWGAGFLRAARLRAVRVPPTQRIKCP
jgi:hypothetical protein